MRGGRRANDHRVYIVLDRELFVGVVAPTTRSEGQCLGSLEAHVRDRNQRCTLTVLECLCIALGYRAGANEPKSYFSWHVFNSFSELPTIGLLLPQFRRRARACNSRSMAAPPLRLTPVS